MHRDAREGSMGWTVPVLVVNARVTVAPDLDADPDAN